MSQANPAEPCDGRCCSVFHLSSPLWMLDLRNRRNVARGYDPALDPNKPLMIVDMLIRLTPDQIAERIERFDLPADLAEDRIGNGQFTCRHWDEDSRLCTIYEDRPPMCRDYPNHGKCGHGCGACAVEGDG